VGQVRAISDSAKLARRAAIIAAADQLLRDGAFDGFTMQKLAGSLGLAKGTLYLYFATREELVLAVYAELSEQWIDRFLRAQKAATASNNDDPNYQEICQLFYDTFATDGLLASLALRVASGIEPYVPPPALFAAKQAAIRSAKRIGGVFCQIFNCEPADGQRLAWAFLTALSGAQQRAIVLEDNADMPADLQKLGDMTSARHIFLNMVLPLGPSRRPDQA